MTLYRWPVLIPLLACLVVPARSASAQMEERVLYTSVVDQKGAPVTDLTAGDFIVREDKVVREVLRVSRATDPMQIALLVDNSAEAESHVVDLRSSVTAFVKAMHETHEIAIVTLADRPTILVDYTHDLPSLEKGVGRIFAPMETGSSLLDAIREVSMGLRKREAPRPVILAIATLGPEISDRYHEEVLGQLRESGAALHVLVLNLGGGSVMDDHGRERDLVIGRGTQQTGGRREELVTSSSLETKIKQIADELSNQYRVTYAHPQTLIPPESTDVSVRRPGLSARGTVMKVPRQK